MEHDSSRRHQPLDVTQKGSTVMPCFLSLSKKVSGLFRQKGYGLPRAPFGHTCRPSSVIFEAHVPENDQFRLYFAAFGRQNFARLSRGGSVSTSSGSTAMPCFLSLSKKVSGLFRQRGYGLLRAPFGYTCRPRSVIFEAHVPENDQFRLCFAAFGRQNSARPSRGGSVSTGWGSTVMPCFLF